MKKAPLCYNVSPVWQPHRKAKGSHSGMNDVNSLTHTSWNGKYHIVFAPKYRRKYFTDKSEEKLEKYCEHCASGKKQEL